MKVRAIKTEKVTPKSISLEFLLNKYLPKIFENSIVVITSKIVSLCEGSVVAIEDVDKHELIKKEADFFIPPEKNQYGIILTLKNGMLVATAGIDESNGNGYYILWPENAQKTANNIRSYLCKKFGLKNIGVIISDSRTAPLRWGTTGFGLAYSGFNPIKNYIGTPDLFGKILKITKSNVLDALSVAAVMEMGEGREQTPLAVITDIPYVKFLLRNPSKKEIDQLRVRLKDDLYSIFFANAPWEKGI